MYTTAFHSNGSRFVLLSAGAAFVLLAGLNALGSGSGGLSGPPMEDDGGGAGALETLPELIEVTGIVRDFLERTAVGGHPDFEQRPDFGFGLYCGNVATTLGEDSNPVLAADPGFKVLSQWKDNASPPNNICYTLFDSSLGDVAGTTAQSSRGAIASADSFAQWYTDVPGVNLSQLMTLTLVLQPDGQYVFDDTLDEDYAGEGGFFPIDDVLYGNSPGTPDHNFHFTFELHMAFEYDADGDQFFKFKGDDDVWVFIDDKLVIDLGGVHGVQTQHVSLDRLDLEDGEEYNIDFFFAERHRQHSNFRLETNIPVRSTLLPTVTAAFD
jgi:fibro-slime domain-containing protein